MIILDIETTGLLHDAGICEIGAVNLYGSINYFVQDCRIDEGDVITEGALKVNGRTREELFDKTKQSQKELIENYLNWIEGQPVKMFYGQNVSWDINMIQAKSIKYDLWERFLKIHGQRGMDLHTIAQEKYKEINGEFFLDKYKKSGMNLGKILEFSGLPDDRISVTVGRIVKKGKVHSALEDCKFPIPEYLKK